MSLPVISPPDTTVSGSAQVAGVLLAAGTSSRFGDANKLLVDVDNQPMVRRSAKTLIDAGLDSIVAVVGYERADVQDALAGLDVSFVTNPDYESGQASSVREGVRALPDVDAAVFALGDMPYVDIGSVRALVAMYESSARSALAAGFEGQRGNPVLFDSRHFDALAGYVADQRRSESRELIDEEIRDVGGKQVLLSTDDAAIVETGDVGVLRDVDHPKDFGLN